LVDGAIEPRSGSASVWCDDVGVPADRGPFGVMVEGRRDHGVLDRPVCRRLRGGDPTSFWAILLDEPPREGGEEVGGLGVLEHG